MSNDTKLLPCPFCEGPPATVVVRYLGGGTFTDAELAAEDDGLHAKAFVFCHECGAEGESIDDIVYERANCDELEQRAISAWQNRNNRNRGLYDWTQVDESTETHGKSPDEIDNVHKQVDARAVEVAPDHVCPACLGTPSKPVVAFMNTGEDWTQHYQQEVDFLCRVCSATGKVSDDVNRRYYAGRLHRHVRAQRGETMRDAAIRLGVTVPQLSAWELGYADLPIGESLQEAKQCF